jgi:hypothetical protein
VAERLAECGTSPDDAQWDSRKRADGNWQVQLMFLTGNRPQMAEWIFDPRRRHATPLDDNAGRLCLSGADLPAGRLGGDDTVTATVTPIARRLSSHAAEPRAESERLSARAAHGASSGAAAAQAPAPQGGRKAAPSQAPAPPGGRKDDPAVDRAQPAAPASPAQARPVRKAAGGRTRRSSVPSWDEIMLGNSRQPD